MSLSLTTNIMQQHDKNPDKGKLANIQREHTHTLRYWYDSCLWNRTNFILYTYPFVSRLTFKWNYCHISFCFLRIDLHRTQWFTDPSNHFYRTWLETLYKSGTYALSRYSLALALTCLSIACILHLENIKRIWISM